VRVSSSTRTQRQQPGIGGLSRLETAVVALLLFTAATHVYAGVVEGAPPVLLAGVGFLGGVALYLRGLRCRLLTLLAVPSTAVQIRLWYVVKAGDFTLVGYVDKAAQVVLVAALVALVLRQRRRR
jgi:hypothetical protein